MLDGRAPFRSESVRLLSKGLEVLHHFSFPYCLWSSGAVEHLGKKLLRVARLVLSELKMRASE